jgi:outer membrane protein assembly factor BamB
MPAAEPEWQSAVGPPPSTSASPDATGGERSRRLPLVVMLVVLALVASAIFVAERQGRVAAASAALRYVPADGFVDYATRTTAGSAPTPVITESARYSAAQFNAGLDTALSAQVLGAVDLSYAGKAFWRTTTTDVAGYDRPQETRVYLLGRSVDLLAESWPGHGLVFHPGLVELPEDVHPGSRWQGAGSAGADLDYTSSFTAQAASNRCLRVIGEIRLSSKAGRPRPPRSVDKIWCERWGVTTSTETIDGVSTATVPAAPVEPAADLVTSSSVPRWPAPDRWRAQSFATVSVDPTFGEGAVSGTPAALPPVMTSSGVLYRVVGGADDLLAFARRDDATWRSLWRLHPGGRVLTASAFGDVVVATTSRRQVVAYTDRGVRLWSLNIDELAFAAPVRLSADRLAVVDLAGTIVAADIAAGVVRWRARAGADADLAPTAVAGTLVVADRSGQVTAYDGGDGSARWQVDVDRFSAASGAGDVAIIVDDQELQAIGITDGRRRWIRPFAGTFHSLTAFGDSVVLSSRAKSSLVGADGSARTLPRPYALVTVGDRLMVGWGKDRADVLDPAGKVLAGRDIPALPVTSAPRAAVATAQGVLLLGSGWDVASWGAPAE